MRAPPDEESGGVLLRRPERDETTVPGELGRARRVIPFYE